MVKKVQKIKRPYNTSNLDYLGFEPYCHCAHYIAHFHFDNSINDNSIRTRLNFKEEQLQSFHSISFAWQLPNKGKQTEKKKNLPKYATIHVICHDNLIS